LTFETFGLCQTFVDGAVDEWNKRLQAGVDEKWSHFQHCWIECGLILRINWIYSLVCGMIVL